MSATPQVLRSTSATQGQSDGSGRERAIGAILVDAGRLDASAVETILRVQSEKGLPFGEAGISLGLLKREDVDFAIACQFDYPYLPAGDESVGRDVVAAFRPFGRVVEQLRVLRTQLMLRRFSGEPRRRALAIASAGRGEGRTFIAANLAVVFSQLGERTLLIDADLRNARQARLFKLGNPSGLSDMLAGRAAGEAIVRVGALRNLWVLPAGAVPPNPQELLGRPSFAQLLQDVAEDFDVILVDTPAARGCADAQMVAARAGAALVLARKDRTLASDLLQLALGVRQSGAELVGSVLNDV